MSVKDIAASVVLALLFVALVAIYLVTSQNSLVTGLSVLILAISLVVTIDGGWREVGVTGVIAAIVSAVAIALIGRDLFNTPGVVIFTLVWLGVLFLLFRWVSRNIIRVQRDRAILVVRTYTGYIYSPEGPIAPPIFPIVERKLATIPLYELGTPIKVEKVNTKAGHNIDMLRIHVNYKIVNPTKAMRGILNPGLIQREIAQQMGRDLDEARNMTEFWELIFNRQITVDVENVVRDVVFNTFFKAIEAYRGREDPEFQERIKDRLSKQIENWGAELTGVDIDHFEVEGFRFKDPERETRLKKMEAEREATRVRLVRDAEAESEAHRVTELVKALKESGVTLSESLIEDIVISAIQSSSEWGLEHNYDHLLPSDTPPARAGRKEG